MIDKTHPFANKILELREQGKTIQQICRAAGREDYFIKSSEVKDFLNSIDPQIEESRSTPGKKPIKVIIDVESILERFDIGECKTPEQIMDANQKLASHAMLLQQAILIGMLEAHAKGECKYPDSAVKGFKAISDVYRALWGYDEQVSIKSALMTLTSEGYVVEKNRIRLPVDPDEVDYIIENG